MAKSALKRKTEAAAPPKIAARARVNRKLREELNGLLAQNGTLKPEHIVGFAASRPDSALHAWMAARGAYDPQRAMAEHAKMLARELIMRVNIVIPDGAGQSRTIRNYVSLSYDRKLGNGYRDALAVLSDDELRAQMEATFKGELLAFERRFQMLKDLEKYSPVFRAIRAATK